MGKEFLSRFSHYAERTVHLTDGCVDVSHSPDLYVNEAARQIAPVRMTGNYGGEVLRRVRLFKPVTPTPGLFSPDFEPQIDAAKQTFTRTLNVHPLSFAVFRQAPWHHYGLLSLEQTQVSLRSPYLDNDFVRTVFRAPESAWQSNDVCLRLIRDGDPALRQIRTDMGVAGDQSRLAAAATRSSSCLPTKPSTLTIMACLSGWPVSITCSRPSISSAFSSADISSTIFVSGTGTPFRSTFRKCCLTHEPLRALTWSDRG